MNKRLSTFLKYAVMIVITAGLLWLSFNAIEVKEGESKVDYLLKVWTEANTPFLFLSASMALLSHTLRAERWKLLLNPIGHSVKLSEGFMSVMIGYFINLAIPRGGEVSRCYNLYRLNQTPVNVSLGTVVAERVIDLLFLIVLLSISFFIELENLMMFFESEQVRALRSQGSSTSYTMLIAAFIVLVICLALIFKFLLSRKRFKILRLITKSKHVLKGLTDGVKSVLKLEYRGRFIFYSLLIWVCYYLMMYFVMLAFPETESLGLGAALTIFVIGGIAMAMPLPGGAGSFHVLVSTGLVLLYALPQEKAVAFTFIFHGWQTLVIIIVGALSLIISQIISTKVEHGK